MKPTPKQYDSRNKKKKEIQFAPKRKLDIRIGDVWRYYVGMNVGSETSK